MHASAMQIGAAYHHLGQLMAAHGVPEPRGANRQRGMGDGEGSNKDRLRLPAGLETRSKVRGPLTVKGGQTPSACGSTGRGAFCHLCRARRPRRNTLQHQ